METITNHMADDFYKNFSGYVKCEECKKIFPNMKTLLAHECALKKIKIRK